MLTSLKQVLTVPMQEELLSPKVCFHGKKRINTLEELLEAHPEFKELLVDATEQEVPKPKDKLAGNQRYQARKNNTPLKVRSQ